MQRTSTKRQILHSVGTLGLAATYMTITGRSASAAERNAAEPTKPEPIAQESFRVPTHDPDITLYVRNKRPAGMRAFPAEKILLYVHGATYPASTSFDLPLNGLSMMDYSRARATTSTSSTCRATASRIARRRCASPPPTTRPSCGPRTRPARWGRPSTRS